MINRSAVRVDNPYCRYLTHGAHTLHSAPESPQLRENSGADARQELYGLRYALIPAYVYGIPSTLQVALMARPSLL